MAKAMGCPCCPLYLRDSTPPPQLRNGALDQIGSEFEIRRCERVADCFVAVAMLLEPQARPTVTLGQPIALRLWHMGLEHLGEQVMIPMPQPPVVESYDEEILPVQQLDDGVLPVLRGAADRLEGAEARRQLRLVQVVVESVVVASFQHPGLLRRAAPYPQGRVAPGGCTPGLPQNRA